MHYPGFIAEIGHETNRPKLKAGVWSGYGVVAAFALLAFAGEALGVVPFRWAFQGLIAIKLVSNTLAWLGLRLDRAVLPTTMANSLADLVVMTGAIYYTGGQASPLFVIYVIEIAVIALLSNGGVTLVAALVSVALFSGMSVLIHLGVLTQYPSPLQVGQVTTSHLVLGLVFAAFVLLVPTAFTTSILRVLRAKERALEARTRELIDAGRQKSQFMANVTHELRTPIHGIAALSELMTSGVYGELNDKQREAHASIDRSARAIMALVDQLLLLAKDEAGKLSYAPRPTDLGEVLDVVSASVGWMVELKRQELQVRRPEEAPLVLTDGTLLKHVLVNLLVNAVKFTPEEGRIELSLALDDERVMLSVSDNGVGIAPSDQASVFEPFRQLDGSDERSHGGIGLGLALVDKLTALMGGEVRLQSAAGEGATFTVSLPRQDAPAGQA